MLPLLLAAAGTTLLATVVAVNALYAVTLQPKLALVLAFGVGAGVAMLLQPRWVVPVLLGVTYMSIGASHFGGLPSPTEVGAVVLLPVVIWRAVRRPEVARDVLLVAGLFVLPMAAATIVSGGGADPTIDNIRRLVFLAIAALCLRGVEDVDRVVKLLVALGIVLGVGAAWSVLVGPTALFKLRVDEFGEQAPRAAGPFGEPNFFALSLVVLMPLALLLVSRGGRERWLGFASALALFAGVLAAGSRAALLTLVVAIVASAIVYGPRARRATLAVVVAMVPLVAVFATQAASSTERQIEGRATENLVAVEMFADRPVAGVGPGQYTELYRDYARDIGNDPRSLRFAHSLPLEVAAEQGLFGIVGWLAVIAFVVRFVVSRRLWREPLGAALLVSLASFAFDSLFLHGSQLRILHIMLGLLLALGWAVARDAPVPSSGR